jgi:hypothetical protein
MATRSRAHVLVSTAVALTLGGFAAPAAFAAAPVPSSCSFNSTDGITTCTTVTPISDIPTQPTSASGPVTDESPLALLCLKSYPNTGTYSPYLSDGYSGVILKTQGATSTTTTYHGQVLGSGKKPVTTTVHTTVTYTLTSGILDCQDSGGIGIGGITPDGSNGTPWVTVTT